MLQDEGLLGDRYGYSSFSFDGPIAAMDTDGCGKYE